MKHPVSRCLFAYWDHLRDGRTAPERSAVDPAAIRDVLAYTFLLEIGDDPDPAHREVTFRLSGTRLNALFQRDLKGEDFAAIWMDPRGPETDILLDSVLDDRLPVVATLRGAPDGYAPAEFELLLLPLRHHGRTHARVLGSFAAGTVPSWVGLRPIAGLVLSSFRTTLPANMPAAGSPGRLGRLAAVSASAFAAPGPAIPPSPAPTAVARAVGPFRVYEGGRPSGSPARSEGPLSERS